MTPKNVSRVAALAQACAQPGEELVRIHLIEESERPYAPGSIRRAGGMPIGVDEITRPRYKGAFMPHVLTIDLDEVPEVRALDGLSHARAIAVFISDVDDHWAWEAGTEQTTVLALTNEDIRLGEWSGPEVRDPAPRAFDLFSVEVPARAFYDPFAPDLDEEALEPILVKLHKKLMSVNRIGGPVIHWSGDTYTKDFVLQCGEEIVDINMGDAGTLYVFANTAYTHSH